MTTDTLREAEAVVERIPLGLLRPAPDNPRTTLGDLEGLAASIRSIGIIQPLTVVPTGELGDDDNEIMLIVAGHRRLGAARLADLDDAPVIVRHDIDESTRLEMMFDENYHREDLSIIENARLVKLLVDAGMKQAEIAERRGVSQPTVSKWLSLLKLPESVHAAIDSGDLRQEDGVAMASLPPASIAKLMKNGAPKSWHIDEEKRRVERDKTRAKVTKEAKDKGWAVLTKRPSFHSQGKLGESPEPALLDDDREDPYGPLAHIDPTEHEHEPCHAVFFDDHQGIMRACNDPAAHPKPKGWKSPAEKERVDADRKRKAKVMVDRAAGNAPTTYEERQTAADLAVAPVVEWCRAALEKAGSDIDGALGFVVRCILADSEGTLGWPEFAARLLDSAFESTSPDEARDLMAEMLTGLRASGAEVLYALALGSGVQGITELLSDAFSDGVEKSIQINRRIYIEPANLLFDHLTEVLSDEAAVPDLEAFLTDAIQIPEVEPTEPEKPAVEVELFKKAGTWRQRCSECGVLQGANKEELYARQRGDLHLRDVHGIELSAEGAA